jgi:hypothetical protein
MPRRSHDRRRSGPADRVLDRLAKGAAGGCRATVVEAEGGLVGFVLIACDPSAACPRCEDARGRMRPWPAPPAN